MLNAFAALCFAGFVGGALTVAATEAASRDAARRRAVSAFLLYFLALSFGAGLSQHDAWPFSKWPLAATPGIPVITTVRIVGVDAQGVEHDIDHRAWEPIAADELIPWMQTEFPRLPRESQDRVASHLLARAEAARRAARAGKDVGYLDRKLGALAAPRFLLHPRIWARVSATPAERFLALRCYAEAWNVEDRGRGSGEITRSLLYESPRP